MTAFKTKTIRELFDEPPEQVSYCVEGLLPSGSLTILLGKPKSGKSSLARQLVAAAVDGKPFLGMEATKCEVLYLAIEEKESEVRAHFEDMGVTAAGKIHLLCGAISKDNATQNLEDTLKQLPEVKLVILDPLFRFIGVRDSNDFVQVNDALQPLQEMARNYNVHVVVVHHLKKRETEDMMDGALGSTAITAGVDTLLMLKRTGNGTRILCTRQRYGKDMEPTELVWDETTRQTQIGKTVEESAQEQTHKTHDRIHFEILNYIAGHPSCTQADVFASVHGKTSLKKSVFQSLKELGLLIQTSSGVKGAPYTYSITGSTGESEVINPAA